LGGQSIEPRMHLHFGPSGGRLGPRMIGLEALHEMLVAALIADGAKRADVVLRDHFSGTSDVLDGSARTSAAVRSPR
jgi:hypothetical protein